MTNQAISLVRKAVVLTIGIPVLLLGIALIPLPGPGLLVTLLGLFILSLEFQWAKCYVVIVKEKLKLVTASARQKLEEAKKDNPK